MVPVKLMYAAFQLGRTPFFSVQRLHGFRQVVQHALWHCKSINFQINTQGRLLIEGHKRELVKDLQ